MRRSLSGQSAAVQGAALKKGRGSGLVCVWLSTVVVFASSGALDFFRASSTSLRSSSARASAKLHFGSAELGRRIDLLRSGDGLGQGIIGF